MQLGCAQIRRHFAGFGFSSSIAGASKGWDPSTSRDLGIKKQLAIKAAAGKKPPLSASGGAEGAATGGKPRLAPAPFTYLLFAILGLISSGVVFIMNTIPSQGIEAVCIIPEGKALIPYGKSCL